MYGTFEKFLPICLGDLFSLFAGLQLNFSRYTPHVFHMTGCVFDVISGQPFGHFGTLKRIQISDNHIPQLAPLVFAGLESLQLLNFQNNRLTGIHPDLFQSLTQLTTLDMSGNELTHIPDGLFRKNTLLRKLILKDNNLTSLCEHTLQGWYLIFKTFRVEWLLNSKSSSKKTILVL